MDSKLKDVISRILHLREEEITRSLSMETCAQWSSLKHVELIAELEGVFGVTIGEDYIFDLLDIESIEAFLEKNARTS